MAVFPLKRVLVLDDDPGIQELLRLALESEGYEVAVAKDGIDGLEALKQAAPDVIVVDLMMPRMDGIAFAHELERLKLRPRIPLLVLTAATRAAERAQSMKAEGFVEKPFALQELLRQVARLAA
ncbi:MAG TPA: response regulator [Chloroflexota bacterium]|nr:response regulator [Chloroflexota bacterium]